MRKILFFLWSLFFLQCAEKRPDDILDENTYKEVLKEIILAHQLQQHIKIKKKQSDNYLPLVYKKFGIDSLKLKKTTDYYTNHPELLLSIYSKIEQEFKTVLDTLNKKYPSDKSKKEPIKILKKQINLKERMQVKNKKTATK